MLWRLYLVFIVLVSALLAFYTGFSRIHDILHVLILIGMMVGVYGYAFDKRILTSVFWKGMFAVGLLWMLYYTYVLPMPESLSMLHSGTSPIVAATITLAVYVPTFIALYLYSFVEEDRFDV